MKILGLDPGVATVGVGLIETPDRQTYTALDWLTITTPAGIPLPDRLQEIHTDLQAYIQEHQPDLCVVEKLFFATNVQTAIDVAQARGVLLQTVAAQSIPLLEATPLQLKSALTGDGGADKQQVQTMLLHLLKLDSAPQPDDAADALGLAIYGALQQKSML